KLHEQCVAQRLLQQVNQYVGDQQRARDGGKLHRSFLSVVMRSISRGFNRSMPASCQYTLRSARADRSRHSPQLRVQIALPAETLEVDTPALHRHALGQQALTLLAVATTAGRK